jgi:S-DNA-T family DNA segregation ATPase FtsK/SpoIIIE
MAKKNQYRDKSKSTTTAKKKRQKKSGPAFTPGKRLANVIRFLKDERLHKSIGALFLLFSFYLLIAFISFLFTWEADQDKVDGARFWSFVFSGSEATVDNFLGKLGAITSHKFIHNWFGIASFIFVFNFFVIGTRILLKVKVMPILKMLKISILSLLWVSVAFGFLFKTPYDFLGGGFGYHLSNWLIAAFGSLGALLLIAVSALVFVIILFNPSFDWIKNLLKKEETEEEDETEETVNAGGDINIINPIKDEEIVEDKDSVEIDFTAVTEEEKEEATKEVPEVETIIEEPVVEETIEMTTEVPVKEPAADDGEFQVEVADKEEVLTEDQLDAKLEEFGEYDPTLDLSDYKLPGIDLLDGHGAGDIQVDTEELEANKNNILETLSNYNIKIAKIKATIGPTVTLYEIVPAPGVRISKIKNLEDDIALSLAALGIRIIAPIPGKGTIGIEVPNSKPEIVSMRSLIAADKFQNSDMELPVALGKTITNETFITDLTKMPHLLMAGATGQGKSVGLNAILVSILYKKHPAQVKFVLVDPKKVELTLFNKIERHFLAKLPDEEEPIITDTSKVVTTLNSLCVEMDARYEMLKEAQVRNIKEYNAKFIARKLNPEKGHKFLPYIVLVVDEFADLIMTAGKEVETPIARIAQLARAIGIHLIIATQRPSVNIITGTIKANFPARVAFRVTSKIDSRTILDAGGADQLIGRGDMLFSTGNELIRLQCGFVDTPEVDAITNYIGGQRAYPEALLLPEYVDESASGGSGSMADEDRDVLFEDAARVIVLHQQGSASLLQRKLKLGYNRAGRIIDQLEAAGIIGPFEGSKARKVLVPDELSLNMMLNPPDNSGSDTPID